MSKSLTKRKLATKLKSLHPDWELSKAGTSISRKYLFPSYMRGFMFVTKVSVHSEVSNHHPEVHLTYNYVKITLTTHDAKSVTLADFELAAKFDDLYTLSTAIPIRPHNHY
ncbi:4a-hydroxytetrahydrobiopterin dehydratase [Patescibacteria group bacterium]|nr:4a-hydroxytetrahydrobiopterin dehydratase [Patescibacteria group bacterium]